MATVTIRPISNGYYVGGTASGAPTNWECLDELILDSDTTYVYMQAVGYYIMTYKYTQIPYRGYINNVSFCNYARVTGALDASDIYQIIRTYNTNYSYAAGGGLSYALARIDLTENPYTNQKWTWEEVNLVEYGGTATITSNPLSNQLRFSMSYIEITYQPRLTMMV